MTSTDHDLDALGLGRRVIFDHGGRGLMAEGARAGGRVVARLTFAARGGFLVVDVADRASAGRLRAFAVAVLVAREGSDVASDFGATPEQAERAGAEQAIGAARTPLDLRRFVIGEASTLELAGAPLVLSRSADRRVESACAVATLREQAGIVFAARIGGEVMRFAVGRREAVRALFDVVSPVARMLADFERRVLN